MAILYYIFQTQLSELLMHLSFLTLVQASQSPAKTRSVFYCVLQNKKNELKIMESSPWRMSLFLSLSCHVLEQVSVIITSFTPHRTHSLYRKLPHISKLITKDIFFVFLFPCSNFCPTEEEMVKTLWIELSPTRKKEKQLTNKTSNIVITVSSCVRL